MGKKTPAAPAPPDPVVTAQAQGQMNEATARTTARLSRVNQTTPYGSLTYTDRGGDWARQRADQEQAQARADGRTDFDYGRTLSWAQTADANPYRDVWEATQTLSPAEQDALSRSNEAQAIYGRAALGQLGRVEDTLSRPMDTSRLPELRSGPDFTGIGDPNQSREAVQAALMDRLNPQLDRERANLETRLANQGITMGSDAWTRGMGDFGRQANDARLGAIINAGQEQSRVYGLGMQQAAFNNQARTQGLSELTALRQMPINEASALLNGSAVQAPSWVSTPGVNVAPTDYMGAVNQNYQGQMAAWQQKAADIRSQNQMVAQLGGQLLGSAASFGLGAFGGGLGGSAAAGTLNGRYNGMLSFGQYNNGMTDFAR